MDQPLFTAHPTQLRCSDGRLLAATWFGPVATPLAIAVISPAMAVAGSFYRAFAEWLACRGYAVLCYDYRGIGASRTASTKQETARLRDWARLDMAAALHAADRRRRLAGSVHGKPLALLWIGHSFGGNALGLVPGYEEKVDAVLGVAAQAADWRFWYGRHKLKAWLFFHAMLPVLAHGLGHVPGRLFGSRAQDLPKPAALEWAAWGRRRGFMFTDPSLQDELAYDRFDGPVHLWNVTDDHLFGPAAAVDELAQRFSAARVQRHTLAPQAVGLKAIGHFAMFRRELGERLWPLLMAPVEAGMAFRPR
ncbi:alpha/beta fold hydrolase [Pelomonas sp. SE-A7]|uniref:alpha/beta hydrolase family protein n=1 Tax=Pelomonas sp. SE-A7 TaxID=3054953 RepID=UPI00259D29A6|nr:alpha/beta fold hydrolase [Pelomonas sp. SE-A7]MDM4767795.1 alpha/beta fold hydrolase [Pelomonas sp. SE-A7]